MQSGKHLLVMSISRFDPKRNSAPNRSETDLAAQREQQAAVTPALEPPQRPSAPVLVAPLSLNAEAAVATRFDVSVGGNPDDLPPGTVVRVLGLPGGATLSGGQASDDRGWVVPLLALDDLKIGLPPDTSGDFNLTVALVDNNGAALAERGVSLRIKPRVAEAPSDLVVPNKTTVEAPASTEASRSLRAKANDAPVTPGRQRSDLNFHPKKPPGTTSVNPGGRDGLRDLLSLAPAMPNRVHAFLNGAFTAPRHRGT
jgi:hypothetical protein